MKEYKEMQKCGGPIGSQLTDPFDRARHRHRGKKIPRPFTVWGLILYSRRSSLGTYNSVIFKRVKNVSLRTKRQ